MVGVVVKLGDDVNVTVRVLIFVILVIFPYCIIVEPLGEICNATLP